MNKSGNEMGFITEADRYLFGEGTHYEIYHKLGAHPTVYNGIRGFYFAVWAPHAKAVSVVGDFNSWNIHKNPMNLLDTSGIYETFIPKLETGELYKFYIETESDQGLYKADPYAFEAEYRPGTASITADPSSYSWADHDWLNTRKKADPNAAPLAIYEVHLGSWRKNDFYKDGYFNYRDYAHQLADYVKGMGYNAVELMGIAEHPYDGSWGYQVTGYYAPTSRYGKPEDFKYFIDYLHKHKISVILDWVPAHFPKDAHGLALFDGQPVYEYADPRKGEHADWGTKVFDYAKHEVSNFLIANALFWIKEYHIDGLRVDAVASMLYLDYGRNDGQWIPNQYGENKNLEAVEFFKHLNSIVRRIGDGAIMIAEESTSWPKVTDIPEHDGLGFHFKWNMGWMHDFLEYMQLDPYFRKHNHHKMTFSMTYAASERFVLVLSHDEVVHLKKSMLEKMPGTYDEKVSNLKLAYTFMFGHPGKKLLFMGQDFGQIHEWDEKTSLEWHLTSQPEHLKLQNLVKDLLHLYQEYPALSASDYTADGFEWINANDAEHSIFSFIRRDRNDRKQLLFVCNFTPVKRTHFRIGVPELGNYRLIFDQDKGRYPLKRAKIFTAEKKPWDNRPYSIKYTVPSYGAAIFSFLKTH